MNKRIALSNVSAWKLFSLGFLVLVLVCAGSPVKAQLLYTGHITDAVAKNELSGVEVRLHSTGQTAITNAFGEYVLKAPSDHSIPSGFSFFNHLVLWEGHRSFRWEVYSLAGQRVQKGVVAGEGHFALPRLSMGLFILRIEADGKEEVHKLFSNGNQTTVVGTHARLYHQKASKATDTLYWSKEGYYTRKIPVGPQSTHTAGRLLSELGDDLDYLTELFDPMAYHLLSSEPYRSSVGGITTLKVVYDLNEKEIYYANTKKHTLHYDFVRDGLKHRIGHGYFNQTQYTQNPNRYLLLGELNYYESKDIYVLQFSGLIEFNCSQIKKLYNKILETSFLGDQLYFYSIKPEWDKCSGMQMVDSETLFDGLNYQALTPAENYGYLRKLKLSEMEGQYLSRRDVVVLDGIPNDISVVAGIITTEFQSPMSHINVLSNSRGTPNMALRDAWSNAKLEALVGELVYINVQEGSYELRKASPQEAEAYWLRNEPQEEVVLKKDLSEKNLIRLKSASIEQIHQIGGKAAQFAEIMKVSLDGGGRVPTPEGAFAIPFYHYHQHMERHGLNKMLDVMLKDARFIQEPEYRQARLTELRQQILEAPLDQSLIRSVEEEIGHFKSFSSYRFRSSTNAEDLEFFSGAGLYDSKSAKKDHAEKTIENAIRAVWASLWDWRAFEERSYFKIDHQSCAMGILVHRSFPDEDANGVVLTSNLYNNNPGLIINAQYKEHSIVFPEPGIIHDQIMVYTWSLDPSSDYTIEYLTFSNVEELKGKPVLSNDEIEELSDYCMAIKERFYYKLDHSCACTFTDFTVDIEFKVDSEVSPRKIYIKQARLYKR